jgi:hypothetical protein
VPEYRFTEYFEKEVLRKRPYLKKEWCIRVLEEPLRSELQEGNRYRFWGKIEELRQEFRTKEFRVKSLPLTYIGSGDS